MSKERLMEAQTLIKDKRYDEAREILETLPDNPTAQQWLKKLDDIAPVAARSQTGADDSADEAYAAETTSSYEDDTEQDAYQAPTRDIWWEYCILEEAEHPMTHAPMYRVEFLNVDGKHTTTADSDFNPNDIPRFQRVFKQVIAQLGMEGWELVTVDIYAEGRIKSRYTFKRMNQSGT